MILEKINLFAPISFGIGAYLCLSDRMSWWVFLFVVLATTKIEWDRRKK